MTITRTPFPAARRSGRSGAPPPTPCAPAAVRRRGARGGPQPGGDGRQRDPDGTRSLRGARGGPRPGGNGPRRRGLALLLTTALAASAGAASAGTASAAASGSGAAGGVQAPDFSGTWQLDRGASEIPTPRRGRRGLGGRRGGGDGAPATLVVTQSPDRLTVEQQTDRGARTATYRLDGGQSTNDGPRGAQVTTSRWDGAALVTEGVMQVSTPRGEVEIDLVDRWTLGGDGRTLTVESTRTTPLGEIATTLVYRR